MPKIFRKIPYLLSFVFCAFLLSCSSALRTEGFLEGENYLVNTPLPGQVLEVMVKEGEGVKAGQALARIDDEELKINIKNAEAALSVLNSELDRARTVLNRLPRGNPMYSRLKEVYEVGGISKSQLNQASSAGNDSSLRSQAELLVKELEAQQAKASAKVDELKALESKTTLTSPAAGIVLKRYLQTGQRLASGDPAFLIANTQKMYLTSTVSEVERGKIALGDIALIVCEAFPGKSWNGEIIQMETPSENQNDRVAQLMDPESKRQKIKIRIDNSDGSLKPGMKASGKISSSR